MINYGEIIKEDSGIFLEGDSLPMNITTQTFEFSNSVGLVDRQNDSNSSISPPTNRIHKEITKRIKKKITAQVTDQIKQKANIIISEKIRCIKEKQNFARIYPLTYKSVQSDSLAQSAQRQGLAEWRTQLSTRQYKMSFIDSLRVTGEEIQAKSDEIHQGLMISLSNLKAIVIRFLEDPGHYLAIYERHFFDSLPFIVYCEIVDVFNKTLGLIKAKRRLAMFTNETDRLIYQTQKIRWVL